MRGAVGATYNFAGRHYLKLMRAFEDGDMAAARAAQLEATEMIKTLASFGFLPASKAVMALIGVDCGPVRPPLRNLNVRTDRFAREQTIRTKYFCATTSIARVSDRSGSRCARLREPGI